MEEFFNTLDRFRNSNLMRVIHRASWKFGVLGSSHEGRSWNYGLYERCESLRLWHHTRGKGYPLSGSERVGKEDLMSQETVTSADGTPIAYWRSGEGPYLVLVHGTAADHGAGLLDNCPISFDKVG